MGVLYIIGILVEGSSSDKNLDLSELEICSNKKREQQWSRPFVKTPKKVAWKSSGQSRNKGP